MRDDYSRAENPIVQLVDYVNKLSTNKVADKLEEGCLALYL